MEENPYAPPDVAETMVDFDRSLYFEGDKLVVRKGDCLPPICLMTGEFVDAKSPPITKKLSWAPSWIWVLILVNLLVVAVVGLIMQKKGVLSYYLTPAARAKRGRIVTSSWLCSLLGTVLFIYGLVILETGGFVFLWLIGLCLLIGGIILYMALGRVFYASKIDNEWIWLKVRNKRVVELLRHHAAHPDSR